MEALIETYGTDPRLLDAAMRKGLTAVSPATAALYCRMVIEHLKGAPEQTLYVEEALKKKVTHKLYPGPTRAA